jgi:hypothetical protein
MRRYDMRGCRNVWGGGFNRIFRPKAFGRLASTEFFVPECWGRKIQLNFLSRSVGDEKFNRIFCPEVSGAKNSTEFFVQKGLAWKLQPFFIINFLKFQHYEKD